jgi:hypothetical protein
MGKSKRNAVVKLHGDVGKFSVQKMMKDGELKSITTRLCIPEPDFGTIAQLCVDPGAAEAAMIAAAEARAKIELPVRQEEMIVRWKQGKDTLASNTGASLREIILKGSKNEVVVEFGEPFLTDVGQFYLENLGVSLVLEIEPQQKELEFKGEDVGS